MLCKRSADTVWQIAHNEGTGATNFTSTGITIDTAIHTFETVADDDATNKWRWCMDTSGTWTDLTSADNPAQGTALSIQQEIESNDTLTNNLISSAYMWRVTKKNNR